jgi:tetratricopeptide (TPR) repeat protein
LRKQLRLLPAKYSETRYQATQRLFEALRDYRYDSTFVYAQRLIELSKQSKNSTRLAENRLRLGTTLIASGMFKETFDCLRETSPALLNTDSKKQYYILYSWAYSDLAKYNRDAFYSPDDLDRKYRYLDSAINLTTPGTFERLILQAQQKPGKGPDPLVYYLTLMNRRLSAHEEAMVVTGMSRYRSGDEKIQLLAKAAINDIRTSTYRAQAMLSLGTTLNEQGYLEEAFYFLQQASAQANRYGSRLNQNEVARILPVVAAKRVLLEQQQQERFLIYLVSVFVIAIIIGLVCFIIFFQLKKVRRAEHIIKENNRVLEKINKQLWEEGRIKEEYIGFFFSELSGFILKIDKLKNNLHKKIKTTTTEEVLRLVDSIDITSERRQLFRTFDSVFLKLFPDFPDAFNALLREEDRVKPKKPGTLNSHLRIFALMRLGINSNEMIAAILEYTVSTVYTYRFRTRSKAIVPADEFEQRIMSIQLAPPNA